MWLCGRKYVTGSRLWRRGFVGGNISLEVGFVSLKTRTIPSFLLALQDVSSQLPLPPLLASVPLSRTM